MVGRTVATVGMRGRPLLFFAAGAAAVIFASRAIVASRGFAARSDLIAVGVTLDLTVTITVLFWMTLVRARALPRTTSVAVFLAGVALASSILPPEHRAFAARLKLLSVPAELALVAWLAWSATRIVRSMRESGSSLPFEDALRVAGRESLGSYRSVDAILAELTVIFFALSSWGRSPHVPAGAVPFSVHRRSGVGAMFFALGLAGVGETLAAHFLIAHWSPRWAWALTALAVYSGLWLVGDWRAMVLRPVLVTDRVIHVRVGVRWRATIPLVEVRSTCIGPDPARHRGCAVASPLGAPNVYLHLDRVVELQGPLGLRRRSDCVGMRVDDPGALGRLLRARCGTSG